MINKDRAAFGPGDFQNLHETVRRVLGTPTKGSFRLNDDTSIGIQLYDAVPPRIGITLRERTPARDGQGHELFPYKRLVVSSQDKAPPHFAESWGAQIRNKKGIPVDWTGGTKTPKREKLSWRKKRKQKKLTKAATTYPIDISVYIDALESIDRTQKEDSYGRTVPEIHKERRVVTAFDELTEQLLYPSRKQAQTRQKMLEQVFGRRHTRQFPRSLLQKSYPLPNESGNLIVKEVEKGFLLMRTERVVFLRPNDPTKTIWEYRKRKADNRLVATTYAGVEAFDKNNGLGPSPLVAETGEFVIDLLRAA